MLVAAGTKARGGESTAVVLVGDPGVGKSRLLREAIVQTTLPVLEIRGYELEKHVPLAAAREVLKRRADSSGPGAVLQALLYGSEESAGELQPLRVFEATYQSLRTEFPLLVVVDDLQWVDENSLALCHYLVRAAMSDGKAAAVIAASRPSDAAGSFSGSMQELLGRASLVERRLDPLDREDAVRLASLLTRDPVAVSGEDIWRKAGGSPFWIEMVARSGGRLEDLARLVSSRLESAGADPADVMAVLSVGGRPFAASEIASVLDWPSGRAERAGLHLESRGLVARRGKTFGTAHDLISEAARSQLPVDRRNQIHRSLAAFFEERAGEDFQTLFEALRHRCAAGDSPVRLALRLALSPQRRLVGREGAAELGRIADDADLFDEVSLSLQSAVARLEVELGERSSAYRRYRLIAERMLDPHLRARAALNAAWTASDLGLVDDAQDCLDMCRKLDARDPILSIEADALEYTIHASLRHDTVRAQQPRLRALNNARRLVEAAGGIDAAVGDDLRKAYMAALRVEHNAAMMADDHERLVAAAQEMAAASVGHAEDRLQAEMDVAGALFPLGRWTEAAGRLRRLLPEAERRVLPTLMSEIAWNLSYCLYRIGSLDEAAAVADNALHLKDVAPPSEIAVSWFPGLAHAIELARADWQKGAAGLEETARAERDPHARVRLHQWTASWVARLGGEASSERVRSAVDDGERDAVAADCKRCRLDLWLHAADALIRIGQEAESSRLLAAWDVATGNQDVGPMQVFSRAWVESLIQAKKGEPEIAAESLHGLLGSARDMDLRLDEVWLHIDLATIAGTLDRDRAIEAYRAAIVLADAIGATSSRAAAARLLRGLGARPSRGTATARSGDARSSLTRRELEVARLAADGRRNAEIAEALFLSIKTVERHLSNIYLKLELRNRAELGSKLAGTGSPVHPPPKTEGFPR